MFKKIKVIKIEGKTNIEKFHKKIQNFGTKPEEKNDIYNLYRVCGHKVRIYHKNHSVIEIIDDESWETVIVKGIQTKYQVNKFGGVRRNKNYLLWSINNLDYCNISIYIEKKKKTLRPHQLVANAFIPNPDNKPQINHIDSNKRNNYVYNLEWVTASENMKHHYSKFARKKPKILSDDEIIMIRKLWVSDIKYTYQILSKLFNVSQTKISRIVNNHDKPELQP